jgi:glycosyltransferase involved in cell wall biosynthesis
MKLSIVMPALNEEANIEEAISDCLKALWIKNIEGEIIVVNDGSTDRTGELVEKIMEKENRVRMIRHHSPKGIGASFWEGTDAAKGDVIIMLPGDNENDPQEIMRYYALLKDVDIVIPFVFNKHVRGYFRALLSLIYRFIINTTFRTYLNYTNGTILYRKSILQELDYRSKGFFFQTDILIRAIKKGYLFAEVPYRLGIRDTGESKAMSFPSLFQVIRGYIRLVRDYYFRKDLEAIETFAQDSSTEKRHNTTV